MELNDNSSTRKSSRNLSSPTPILKKFRVDDAQSEKQSVVCTFCSKKTTENFAILNDKPDLLGTLAQLDIEISSITDHFDYICYQCVFKIHCIQDYKRIWTANIYKTRINHYYRRGDKEMVRRLIALKPSTSNSATQQSRTRSNALSFNRNSTKEGSIISQSTDNNSNLGQDDCLQDSEKEEVGKRPTVSENLSEIEMPSINSVETPKNNNQEKRQKLKHQQSPNSSDNILINTKLKKIMPRRSLISSSEITNLNQTNNSAVENGFPHESSTDVTSNLLLQSSRKNQKASKTVGKASTSSNYSTLLNVMYEENEPVTHTESGGEISSRPTPYQEIVTMKCKYCDRTYKRLTFLMRHQRKHERDNQKATSARSTAHSKVVSVLDCPDCNQNFLSKRMYNEHKKVHVKILSCRYCTKEFELKWEADFHEAVCSGKVQASQTETENCYKTSSAKRYYTRSVKAKFKEADSRINLNEEENDYDDDVSDTTEIDSLYSSKMRNTRQWTQGIPSEPGDDPSEFEDISSSIPGIEFFYGGDSSEDYNDDTVFSQIISCQHNTCDYTNTELSFVMKHDKETHGIRPAYHCKKCNISFLRKYYYDLHYEKKDPGSFLCYICRGETLYLEDLFIHLDVHKRKMMKKEDYPCELCKLSFLNETNFMQHLTHSDHLKFKSTAKIKFKKKHCYPVLQQSQENNKINNSNNKNNTNNNSNNYNNINKNNNSNNNNNNNNNNTNINNDNNNNDRPQIYSQIKILKLKKYPSKKFKYECNCINKICYDCQQHRKMIPNFGIESKTKKRFRYRSCNAIKLPYLKSKKRKYICIQ